MQSSGTAKTTAKKSFVKGQGDGKEKFPCLARARGEKKEKQDPTSREGSELGQGKKGMGVLQLGLRTNRLEANSAILRACHDTNMAVDMAHGRTRTRPNINTQNAECKWIEKEKKTLSSRGGRKGTQFATKPKVEGTCRKA